MSPGIGPRGAEPSPLGATALRDLARAEPHLRPHSPRAAVPSRRGPFPAPAPLCPTALPPGSCSHLICPALLFKCPLSTSTGSSCHPAPLSTRFSTHVSAPWLRHLSHRLRISVRLPPPAVGPTSRAVTCSVHRGLPGPCNGACPRRREVLGRHMRTKRASERESWEAPSLEHAAAGGCRASRLGSSVLNSQGF